MLKLIRALAVAVFCVSSAPALATLLDRGSFTTDTDSGLDWLDVTATAGMSYGTVLDSHFPLAGWRYATLDELSGLLQTSDCRRSRKIPCGWTTTPLCGKPRVT
jgi:hypothetical protein